MREVTKQLIDIYQVKDIDWMGYAVDRPQDITFHHIWKKSDGGLYTIDNGAPLNGDTAHPYLHIIEAKDFDMYLYINNLLKNINTQGFKPTRNQLLAVRAILEQFEREHCSDRTKKGKQLIKTKYIEGRRKID